MADDHGYTIVELLAALLFVGVGVGVLIFGGGIIRLVWKLGS